MLVRSYTDVSMGCSHGISIEIGEKKNTEVEVWMFQLSLVFLQGRANQSQPGSQWFVRGE